MQQLITKAKLAELAGVNPSTITRVSRTTLKAAVVGKQIDAAHPDVVAYLENKELEQTPPAATGMDPLYEKAIDACTESGRFSASFLQRHLKIGWARADKIIQVIKLNRADKPEAPTPVVTKSRGNGVIRERKKAAPPISTREGTIEIPDDIEEFWGFTVREILEKFGTDTRFVDWLSASQKIEAINEKRLKNAQTKGVLISRKLVQGGVIDVFNSAHLRLMKDGAKSIAAGVISKHSAGAELSEVEAYITDILGSFIKPVKSKIKRTLKDA